MKQFKPGTFLRCIDCGRSYFDLDTVRYRCECERKHGDYKRISRGLLDYKYDYELIAERVDLRKYQKVFRSVWKYIEFLPIRDPSKKVSLKEGGTPLYKLDRIGGKLGCKELYAKFEGTNPTGSFKDRGMTVGVTKAIELGVSSVVCASTGNTAASLASYAAAAGLDCHVLLPGGGVPKGKLNSILACGAKICSIRGGSFTDALRKAEELSKRGGFYFLNSINPIRIEGQKTVAFEIADEFGWQVPDCIVVPVGNAGNISAIYKGFHELMKVGITDKVPRMVGIQPETVAPIARAFKEKKDRISPREGKSVATALEIGSPASWHRALIALKESRGYAGEVSDEEIIAAQMELAKKEGILCEPASACSLAGFKKLIEQRKIERDEKTVLILTGHGLKDPDELKRVCQTKNAIQTVDISELKNYLASHFP